MSIFRRPTKVRSLESAQEVQNDLPAAIGENQASPSSVASHSDRLPDRLAENFLTAVATAFVVAVLLATLLRMFVYHDASAAVVRTIVAILPFSWIVTIAVGLTSRYRPFRLLGAATGIGVSAFLAWRWFLPTSESATFVVAGWGFFAMIVATCAAWLVTRRSNPAA